MWDVGHVFKKHFVSRHDGIETQLAQQATEHSEAVKIQISPCHLKLDCSAQQRERNIK